MINTNVAQQVVDLLNDLIAIDPRAVTALCRARVPCNEALADHPTVQVAEAENGDYEVGLLGVLNGLCGIFDSGEREGWGAVAVIFDDTGRAIGAEVLESPEEEE